jgi:hypothetical protein
MAQRVLVHISRSEQRVIDPDGVYCLVATGGDPKSACADERRSSTCDPWGKCSPALGPQFRSCGNDWDQTAGAGLAGWELGSLARRRLIPQWANDWYGESFLRGLQAVGACRGYDCFWHKNFYVRD